MPTLVTCSCGKKLNVRDELVGKKVKCPACGGILEVAAALVAEEVPEVEETPPARKPPPVPGTTRSAPPPRAKDEPRPTAEEDRPAAKNDLGVFRCTGGGQSRLLCLTDEGAFFADADKKTIKRIEAGLADGESPPDAFGDDPAFIPWGTVTKIDSNLKQDNFQIKFKHASDDDASQLFRFEDKRDRTDALKWMRDHLAPAFTYKRRELTRLQATYSPLITIGILVLVFGFLVWLAWGLQQPHGGGRVRGIVGIIIAYTVGWLGPLWTGVLGGVCILGCVAWMAVRIADPPIEVTITPQAEAKKKRDADDDEEADEEEEERPRAKGKRRRSRDGD